MFADYFAMARKELLNKGDVEKSTLKVLFRVYLFSLYSFASLASNNAAVESDRAADEAAVAVLPGPGAADDAGAARATGRPRRRADRARHPTLCRVRLRKGLSVCALFWRC